MAGVLTSQDLRSPCMRDRHWNALVSVTKVAFEKTPELKLVDILALNLHLHVSEVQEILETASKEMKIEGKLRVIEEYWSRAMLSFEALKDSDIRVLTTADSLLEDLDDHVISLQVQCCSNGDITGLRTADSVCFWLVCCLIAVDHIHGPVRGLLLGARELLGRCPQHRRVDTAPVAARAATVDGHGKTVILSCYAC